MDAMFVKSDLRIAICEDSLVDTDVLTALIEMSKIPHTLDTFLSGDAFLEGYAKEKYDLLFLDVFMEGLSGVQTAEAVREIDTQVVIVFTTTSDEFTREGYRLNAYKYLIKPLAYEDVVDALELAKLKHDKAQGATLAIITDSEPVIIPMKDIIFIESSNRRSLVYTVGETYSTSMTIEALLKLLPSPRFLLSHRSFIVNLDHVDELEEDFIMDNGEIAYIAVKNHQKVKRTYKNYLTSR